MNGSQIKDDPGQKDQVTQLLLQQYDETLRHARSMVGQEGSNATQEFFVTMLALIADGKLDHVRDLVPYFRAARHKMFCDAFNRKATELARTPIDENRDGEQEQNSALEDLIRQEEPTLVELFDRYIGRHFNELDPEDQQLLRIALAPQQVSSMEAAVQLGCTVGAFRVRKHRLLDRISQWVTVYARAVDMMERPYHQKLLRLRYFGGFSDPKICECFHPRQGNNQERLQSVKRRLDQAEEELREVLMDLRRQAQA